MRKLDYQADQEEAPRHMRALHPRFSVRGITGTQLSGGMISGYERNASLTGLNWVREAEDMLRTDPVVRPSSAPHGALSLRWRMTHSVRSSLGLGMKRLALMDTLVRCPKALRNS